MCFSLRQACAWLLTGWLTTGAASALAGTINYGDFGPDFPPGITIYTDVQESSITDPVPPGRYGPPTLSGNDLDFDPKLFGADATNGLSDNTDVQLNFNMMAPKSNGVVAGGFTTLLIEESGHYSLMGGGTAATYVSAGVAVDIDILEVDGKPVAGGPIEVFASKSIFRDLVNDGPVMLAPWSNSLVVEFGPILVANNIGFEFGVTKAEIVINDQVLAASQTSSQAFIAKKDFRIRTPESVPNPEFEKIPEPSSVLLLGSLLAGGWGLRRIA